MKKLNSCRFCNISSGNYYYSKIDEPLLIDEEFMAIASIGALVEGWTLIIPKIHQLSMKNIYANPLFENFINSVLTRLTRQYGRVIAFEHGANKEGSPTACGTDHAHLHLVPLAESLLPELKTSGLKWINCRASEISTQVEENEYLFYIDFKDSIDWKNAKGYLNILKQPRSQFFRHIIAEKLGKSSFSDYKQFPHLDIAMQTHKVLSNSLV